MPEGELAGDGELGEAVDGGPADIGEGTGIAFGESALGLDGDDTVEQRLKGALAGLAAGAAGFPGLGQIEHHLKMLRRAEREFQISLAAAAQAVLCAFAAGHGGAHGGGEAVEALGSDGHEQVLLVAEVAVGGVVGDSGAAGDLAQGECARAGLGDEADGGAKQFLLQILAVVGWFSRNRIFIPENVDSSNIIALT